MNKVIIFIIFFFTLLYFLKYNYNLPIFFIYLKTFKIFQSYSKEKIIFNENIGNIFYYICLQFLIYFLFRYSKN